MSGIDACSHSEFFCIDVCGRTCASRCVVEVVGFGFDFSNQIFHILVALAGGDHHHIGQAGQRRDAHQIIQGVIRQVGVDGRIDHVA